MRVLHVTEAAVGGVATYLNELLQQQQEAYGYGQVAVLVPDHEVPNIEPLQRAGITVYDYVRTGRNGASLWRLHRAVGQAMLTFQPHVIHLHSSIAGGVARLRRHSTVCFYSPHGWAFEIDQLPTWLAGAIFQVERFLSKRCSAVITVSEHERQAALARGMPSDELRLVRSGLSDIQDAAVRCPSDDSSEVLKVLFVGRLDRQKGLDWLLSVWPRLPIEGYELSIAGHSVRNHTDTPTPEYPNVRWLGWLDAASLDRAYDAADVLIVPSRWEAFGLVAVEAMRRGKPILVSRRGALPELLGVENGCGRSFELDSGDDLLNILQSLDRGTLVRWGGAARQRYLDCFSAAGMFEKMDETYRECLEMEAVS